MKEWMTSSELAGLPGLPGTDRAIQIRGKRDGWQSRARKARGGGREYHISSLPEQTRAHLAAQHINSSPSLTGGAIADAATKNAVGDRAAGFSYLVGRDRRRADARLAFLALLDEFTRASSLSKSKALHLFCAQYNAGDVVVPEHVRAEIPDVHPSTVHRWRGALQSEGVARLGGNYGNRKGSSKIDTQPEVHDLVLGVLTGYPHASSTHVTRTLKARLGDRKDIELPSKRSIERWLAQWKQKNKQLFTAISNPDAWKGQYMPAFGSASEHVFALNQLWELDSTPADLMLLDGRHSLIGSIDVHSRRPKLHVSKTSKASAVAHVTRRCLIDWGVPETVKTDNGADYKSNHIRGVFTALNIEQEFCPPFQPWKKPHIERFFRTFSHDLVELLPGYIGHNVAERKAIEARKSFSERLFKKDQVVELRMTSAQLQEFCDGWIENIYMVQPHDGLGKKTPLQIVAEWQRPVRTIDDERALDMLLIEEVWRVVSKKGIRIDGGLYIHPDLALLVGDDVLCKRDPEDVGRLYVFAGEPLQFICVAEDPNITGISRQDIAIEAARQRKEFNEEIQALKKASRQQNVADLAQEIIRNAARDNNVTLLPKRSDTHTTEFLEASADAARAHQTPSPNLTVTAEEREALQRDLQTPAPVVETDNPMRRYQRWVRIEKRIAAGEYVTPEDRQGLQRYQQTSEYRTRRMMAEDFMEIDQGMDA